MAAHSWQCPRRKGVRAGLSPDWQQDGLLARRDGRNRCAPARGRARRRRSAGVESPSMFKRRRSLRRASRLALTAFLFSTLAATPLGSHAHPVGSGANFHQDLCRSVAEANPAPASLPATADGKSKPCTGCADCAGCAGSPVAHQAPAAPQIGVTAARNLVGVGHPSVAIRDDDVIVARPRGPPPPG